MAGSLGCRLIPRIPLAVIYQAIQSKKVPADENGIYVLVPTVDVDVFSTPIESTWTTMCTFHDYFTSAALLGGRPVKYAVVPEIPDCSENYYHGTNSVLGNDPGLEAITFNAYASLAATMTDPIGSGYYVSDPADSYYQYESSWLCTSSFDTVCPNADGAYYNTVIGGVQYLLPNNDDPSARICRNFGGIRRQPGASCRMIRPGF